MREGRSTALGRLQPDCRFQGALVMADSFILLILQTIRFLVRYWTLRGCVTAVQFILFNFSNFANHSPSIAMELKVSKETKRKWQNQRSETNKYVSCALFSKLQAAGTNFENCYAEQFSKTLISILFNLLQFCPSVASVVSVMLF